MPKLKRSQIAGMNINYKFYSLEYFLDSMELLGFTAIELWGASPHFYMEDATPQDIARLKNQVTGRGMEIICFTPEQCRYPQNIASPEAVVRRRSVEFYGRCVRACAAMGSPRMLMTSGWGYFDRDPTPAWGYAREGLSALCDIAEREGVEIVLEPLRRDETDLVTGLPELTRMMDEVNSPALKGMLDTSPMYFAGESIQQYFDALGENFTHIHFIDGKPEGHLVWGEGIFPLEEYLDTLEQNRYGNYLTLELTDPRYIVDPHSHMERCVEALAPYFD